LKGEERKRRLTGVAIASSIFVFLNFLTFASGDVTFPAFIAMFAVIAITSMIVWIIVDRIDKS
jgi:hypothetical protein